jgi:hypothetical protein
MGELTVSPLMTEIRRLHESGTTYLEIAELSGCHPAYARTALRRMRLIARDKRGIDWQYAPLSKSKAGMPAGLAQLQQPVTTEARNVLDQPHQYHHCRNYQGLGKRQGSCMRSFRE